MRPRQFARPIFGISGLRGGRSAGRPETLSLFEATGLIREMRCSSYLRGLRYSAALMIYTMDGMGVVRVLRHPEVSTGVRRSASEDEIDS